MCSRNDNQRKTAKQCQIIQLKYLIYLGNIKPANSHPEAYHFPSETQTKNTSAYSLHCNHVVFELHGPAKPCISKQEPCNSGIITPSKQLGWPVFFDFFSHTTEAGHNQNKNCPQTTHSVLLPAVVQIKGSLIYPLVGSCSGYCVIPYFCGLDRCSQRYVDPAAKNAGFLLEQTTQLLSRHAYLPSM